MEDEENKSYGAQHHSAASIQMYFPHQQCRRHLNPPPPPTRLSSPQRVGKRGLCMPCSLDQMLQFTPIKGGRFKSPDWVSIPLLVIAHSIFKFQQPLCESGKQAVLISETQAFLGSAAGVSASGLMLNWLTGQ